MVQRTTTEVDLFVHFSRAYSFKSFARALIARASEYRCRRPAGSFIGDRSLLNSHVVRYAVAKRRFTVKCLAAPSCGSRRPFAANILFHASRVYIEWATSRKQEMQDTQKKCR